MTDAPLIEIAAQRPPITAARVESFTPIIQTKFKETHGMSENELVAAIPKTFIYPEQTRGMVNALPMPESQTGFDRMTQYRTRYAEQIATRIPTQHQEKRQAYAKFLSYLAQFAQYQLLDARAAELSKSAEPSSLLDRTSDAVNAALDIALDFDEIKKQSGDKPISIEGILAQKEITGLSSRELGHLAELIGIMRIGLGDVSLGATIVDQSTELTGISRAQALDRSFLVAEAKSIYQLEHPTSAPSIISILTGFLKH